MTNFKHPDHYSFNYLNAETEQNSGKSLTVPDMELNLEKAIERFKRGEPLQTYTGVYTSDYGIPIPEFEKMTHLERIIWASENRDRLKDQQQAIQDAIDAAEQPAQPDGDPEPAGT